MVQTFQTGFQQMILKVTVQAQEDVVLRLIVEDTEKENTVFTDRFYDFAAGEIKDFYVRLPLVGQSVNILIYNDDTQNINDDSSFELLDIQQQHLKKRLDLINLSNSTIRNFIFFAQQFSYNAGWLPCASYPSECKQFQIDYLDAITDQDGNVINTPASTFANGLIEAVQGDFQQMTVPMRMAILLHEFAHVYLNKNSADEEEADKNSLLIFLCLGYPRLEATEAWVNTFWNADTDANMQRMAKIQQFIEDFENKNYYINGQW